LVDTFAGIGGFHLATKRACERLGLSFECVKAVEFDPNACKTYEKNHKVDPTGDMTKIKPEEYPDHFLLTGGFPCQAFSRNGRVYNFTKRNDGRELGEDDRSKLCFYLFDILRVKQPPCFVFENVKEIQTIKNGDGSLFFDTISENLDLCGYRLYTKVMDSTRFGLPQQRKRVYFVGIRKDLESSVPSLSSTYEFPEGTTLSKSVKDILEKSVDKKYTLEASWKNRLIGQETVLVEQTIANLREKKIKLKYADALEKLRHERNGGQITRLEALKLAYSCGEWTSPTEKTDKVTPVGIIYGDTPSGLPRQQDKIYSILGVSPTIATFSTPAFDCPKDWRILTPRECARLQGFPDDFELPERDQLAYKQVGNAISVAVAEEVIYCLLKRLS